ncbi:DUF1716-domain-containing protein [Jackrogersella minutella]|nr:DUF1716-domain-containing protein [Jackrogersella minutella]
MTSIDDLFKASGVGSKRKLEPLRDPNQVYKSARLTSNGHSSRHARVEDEAVDTNEDDIEAGPAPPPEDDENEDYGPDIPPDDDEEGRFYGGGITAQENDALDYVDDPDPGANAVPDKFDSAWLRRIALNFEKRINKNAEFRAKFETEPQKFISSEADLDTDIKALSILSEHPELYPEFAKLGSVASLVGLLAHENTDIAIDAVEIINELTDEDVAADDDQWNALIDALLEADLLGLLVSNFERLDEEQEVDRSGVYYALSVIENLCSGRAATAEQVTENDKLLKWLLQRIQVKETTISQNKQYAAEVLAILVQTSSKNRRKLASLDTTDIMLQLAASYRKRDPVRGGEEEEYMENLFETLTCLVDEPEGKTKFVEAEGVELCLIMLKEGKMSKGAALRLIDHAVGGSGTAGTEVCRKIVEAGGLKNTFTLFMKKSNDSRTTEHLIGIFGSMLRLLPADSAERIRTLAKFVEKDYEKTVKLVKLRREYVARLSSVDEAIRAEQSAMHADEKEEMADEWFSRRLDAGLFCLQTLDVVLAWLVAEDGGARKTVRKLLAEHDETLDVIRATLQEQIEGIDVEDAEAKDTKEMLTTLVEFLQ